MQRLVTIKLPAKASTVANVLAGLDDNLDHKGSLYVAMRSDGLAVYTDRDGWQGIVPSAHERRQLRK